TALRLILVAFALPNLILGQRTVPSPNKNRVDKGQPADERMILKQRALNQLEQGFIDSRALKDDETKIRVQSQVADVIWESDRTRATKMFEYACSSIEALSSTDRETDAALSGHDNEVDTQARLRTELLQLVSKRDPKLAERLVKSVSLPTLDLEVDHLEVSRSDREKAKLYMDSAKRLVNVDPQRAVALAEAQLERQPGSEILNLLFKLQSTDPVLAYQIFQRALSLVERDAAGSFDVRSLAPYVLSNGGLNSTEAALRRYLQLASSYLSR